jgi:hypothetical protein
MSMTAAASGSLRRESYGNSYDAIRCSGDIDSNLDAPKVLTGGKHGQRRPQLRQFRERPVKGNSENPSILSPLQINSFNWDA